MGRVNPGDTISIKRPNRNSLVKAGKLKLQAPDNISVVVPDNLSRNDFILLDSLIEWDILQVEERGQTHQLSNDPLWSSLLSEYETLDDQEAKSFIMNLSEDKKAIFIDYEKSHKNRKSIVEGIS